MARVEFTKGGQLVLEPMILNKLDVALGSPNSCAQAPRCRPARGVRSPARSTLPLRPIEGSGSKDAPDALLI
jgi:hypothetical protein